MGIKYDPQDRTSMCDIEENDRQCVFKASLELHTQEGQRRKINEDPSIQGRFQKTGSVLNVLNV